MIKVIKQSCYQQSNLVYHVGNMISGRVITGSGRGANFISLPIYSKIFKEILGEDPFPGTLNLVIPDDKVNDVAKAFSKGITYDEMEFGGQIYGGIIVMPLVVTKNELTIQVTAVKPLRTSHSESIIEIVSEKNLRQTFDLDDDDLLSIELQKPLLDKKVKRQQQFQQHPQ